MKVLISTFFVALLFTFNAQATVLTEDFQGRAIGSEIPFHAWNIPADAISTVQEDPTDYTNHVLRFENLNWGAVPYLNFVLPPGKSLADFSHFNFNGNFLQGDIGWKMIWVAAYSAPPTGPLELGGVNTVGQYDRARGGDFGWETFSIPISGSPGMTGSIYISWGINASPNGNIGGTGVQTTVLSDNVTLVPRPLTTSFAISSPATEITVAADNLQMEVVDILPLLARADHTWSVDKPYVATIDQTGLLTAVANGVVVVRATANDGTGVFAEITINVSGQPTTSIQDNPVSATVAFPNPVSDILNIAGGEVISRVVVSNLAGAAVLSLNANDTNLQVNVSSLPAGIYVVTVENASGKVQNLRVVKR